MFQRILSEVDALTQERPFTGSFKQIATCAVSKDFTKPEKR